MVREVPPCIDIRNERERDLDKAVRDIHEVLGDELRGFVLVAYGENMTAPITAYATAIRPTGLPDYVADAVESKLFECGAFADNDNGA